MRKIIMLMWALSSTIAHPKPEFQVNREIFLYNNQNNRDLQGGLENNHYNYNQRQANWENYNSDQSKITFEPMESNKELQVTKKESKDQKQNNFHLEEYLSDNTRQLLRNSQLHISKLEDQLTKKSENWEGKLNYEVNRFEDTLRSHTNDKLNRKIEKVQPLEAYSEKPCQYKDNEYKLAIDGSKINPQIVFGHLINSDTQEKRKARVIREASYGNFERWNSNQGRYNPQEPEVQEPNKSWRPRFPGYKQRNNDHQQRETSSYIPSTTSHDPNLSVQYNNQGRYEGQKPMTNYGFEGQSQTDNVKFEEESESQHGLDEPEFGQKRENMGQEQVDEIDFMERNSKNQGPFVPELDYEEKQPNKNRDKSETVDFGKIKDLKSEGQNEYTEPQQQSGSVSFGSQYQFGIRGIERHNEDDGQKPIDIEEMEQQYEYGNHRKVNNEERGHQTSNDNHQQRENTRFSRYHSFGYQPQPDNTEAIKDQQNSQELNRGEIEGQTPVDDVKFEMDQADKNDNQFKSMGHGSTYSSSQGYYDKALAVQSERKEYLSPRPTSIEFERYKEYSHQGYFRGQSGEFRSQGQRSEIELTQYPGHSKMLNNGPTPVPNIKLQDQSMENPKLSVYLENVKDYLLEDQRGTLYWVKLTSNQAKEIEYGIQSQAEKAQEFNVGQHQQMKSETQKQSDEVRIGGQRPYKIQERADSDHLKEKKQHGSHQHTGKINFVKLIPLSSTMLGNQFEGQRQYESQQQTDDVNFGEQRQYGSQQQTDDVNFGEQRQYGSQEPTDDVEFGEQRSHSSQLQMHGAHYGGQRQYGSQQQTDDVEFGVHKPKTTQQQIHGDRFEGQRQYGSQQQTDAIEFGEQRQYGSQQQTDDVEFGGQKPKTTQQQMHGDRFEGQRQFGSQQQTDAVEFGEQRQYGSQQPTDDVEFGGQKPKATQQQMHGDRFKGQRQYGSQQQTDAVEFGEQRRHSSQHQMHGEAFEGQRQYGSQSPIDGVEFGEQRPETNQQNMYRDRFEGQRQYGSQQQTDDVNFGEQRQYGSQQQTDDVEFGEQKPLSNQQKLQGGHFGGQRQFGSQQQTGDVQFGEQDQYGSQFSTDSAHGQSNNQRKLFDGRESSSVYQRNQNHNQGYNNHWSGYQSAQSKYFHNRDSTHSSSNVNPSLENSEFSEHSQNSFRHSIISSSEYNPYNINPYQKGTQGYSSIGIHPETSPNIHRNQESSYTKHEDENSRYRVKIVSPVENDPKIIDTASAKPNKYQQMMSQLDEIEKDLVEQQTKTNFAPMRQYQIETSTIIYPISGYMDHLTNSQEEISSRRHFEYNSDEEEEPKSFWSNLGSKMKSSYNTAKDNTKKLIGNIKESFSS